MQHLYTGNYIYLSQPGKLPQSLINVTVTLQPFSIHYPAELKKCSLSFETDKFEAASSPKMDDNQPAAVAIK